MTVLGILIGALLGFVVEGMEPVVFALAGGLVGRILKLVFFNRNRQLDKDFEDKLNHLEERTNNQNQQLADLIILTNNLQKELELLQGVPKETQVDEISYDSASASLSTLAADEVEAKQDSFQFNTTDSPIESESHHAESNLQNDIASESSIQDTTMGEQLGNAKPTRAWSFQTLMSRLMQGNNLARFGVLFLILGIGFFLQLAAVEGWLAVELCLAIAALGGMVLMGFGWRLRDERRTYGLSLQGGGIGVLYLTVFAAFRFFPLIPTGFAFSLLIPIAVLTGLLAILQDARTLAFLGSLGGFLAPFFAPDVMASFVPLFAYYLVLNIGILFISWRKAWRPLNLLGFFATFVTGAIWGGLSYQPQLFWSVEPFLISFFLLYLAIAILYALRQPPNLKGLMDGSLIFALPVVVFGFQSTLVSRFDFGLAYSSLAMALIYLSLAFILLRLARQTLLGFIEAFFAIGLAFLSMTLPFAFGADWTSVGWSLEGAALIWLGIRQRRVWLRLGGTLLQLAALLSFGYSGLQNPSLGMLVFESCIIALAGFYSAYLFQRTYPTKQAYETILHWVFLTLGVMFWANLSFRGAELLTTANYILPVFLSFWAISSAVMMIVSNRFQFITLSYAALGLLPTIFVASLVTIAVTNPNRLMVLSWLFAFTLASVTLIWILRQFKTLKARASLQILSVWLMLATAFLLVIPIVNTFITRENNWGLALAGLALVIGLLALRTKRNQQFFAYPDGFPVLQTVMPVWIALWLWSSLINLRHPGGSGNLFYLPLINPFDLLQVVTLMTLIQTFRDFTKHSIERSEKRLFTWAIILLGLLWPSAMIARTIRQWYALSYDFQSLYNSSVLQTSLTIFWTVFALVAMLIAARLKKRSPWFIGAGLLVLVVLKLFFIDSAQVTAFARVISFIGVGVLMLFIGYLAPLPPNLEQEADDEATISVKE